MIKPTQGPEMAAPQWRVLARPALIQKLNSALEVPYALVTGAAGSGKSVLLTQWATQLRAQGDHVIWVDMAAVGADTQRMLISLVKGCGTLLSQEATLPHGPGINSLSPTIRHIVAALQAIRRRTIIILDHYDRASSPDMDRIVETLIGLGVTAVHLVLASRTGVRLNAGVPFAIGQDELRLTDGQIAVSFDGRLEANALAAISAWTDGIASAVHLMRAYAALNLEFLSHVSGFSVLGTVRTLPDLTQAIIDALPSAPRESLIVAAFLPEFTVDLIEHLAEQRESWRWMNDLERIGLLTTDEDGATDCLFRCQPQFREGLLHRLHRRGRGELRRLAARASEWFDDTGDLLKSVRYAGMTGSLERVANLIQAASGLDYGMIWGAVPLRELLEHLPPESLTRFPRLGLAQAYLLVKEGRVQIAVETVRAVRSSLPAASSEDPELQRDLAIVDLMIAAHNGQLLNASDLERIATIERAPTASQPLVRAIINNLLCAITQCMGDFVEALSRGRSALHFYRECNSPNGIAHTHIHLGRLAFQMGEPRVAAEHLERAEGAFLGRSSADYAGNAIASVFRAATVFDLGAVEHAEQLCRAAISAVETGEQYHEVLYAGYRTLWSIGLLRQGPEGAARVINGAMEYAKRNRIQQLHRWLQLHWLEIEPDGTEFLSRFGSLATLTDAHTEGVQSNVSWRENDLAAIVQARNLFKEGSLDAAIALLGAAETRCAAADRHRCRIEMRIKAAALLDRAGRRAAALGTLRAAIEFATPRRLIGPFLEDWAGIASLLSLAVPEGGLSAEDPEVSRFVNEVLRIGNSYSPLKQSILSAREQQILEHLVRGESNKMIARALGVSPETVRFHLKNIYGKFGVRIGHKAREVIMDLAKDRNYIV